MNPRLTDDAVADLPLHRGRAELLEEIMRTPVLDDSPVTDIAHARRRAWLAPVIAAAVVALLAATTAWWAGRPDATPEPQPPVASDPADFRAVLDAEGWTVDNAYADRDFGEVSYASGDRYLEISWYPADAYDSYIVDRRHITEPPRDGEPIEVLGLGAQTWAYSATDHTAIREIQAGHWLEIRAGGMGEAAYRELLGHLRLVDKAGFEAAMPASFVDSSERQATIESMLAAIGEYVDPVFPEGSQRVGVSSDETDPYHLGADVAGAVACEWLADFEAASEAGDQARADRAAEALATSRQWPVLQEMAATGEYPDVIWDFARQVGRGQVPEGYADALGCAG
ncbi:MULTISPECIES: hypothetical protein [unclassified Nocardioides]|uniref:hypothetical protein n=1 Tax=unclassified Nocardioides TaxID=2615069 RepID=UPI00360FD0F6